MSLKENHFVQHMLSNLCTEGLNILHPMLALRAWSASQISLLILLQDIFRFEVLFRFGFSYFIRQLYCGCIVRSVGLYIEASPWT